MATTPAPRTKASGALPQVVVAPRTIVTFVAVALVAVLLGFAYEARAILIQLLGPSCWRWRSSRPCASSSAAAQGAGAPWESSSPPPFSASRRSRTC